MILCIILSFVTGLPFLSSQSHTIFAITAFSCLLTTQTPGSEVYAYCLLRLGAFPCQPYPAFYTLLLYCSGAGFVVVSSILYVLLVLIAVTLFSVLTSTPPAYMYLSVRSRDATSYD